MTLLHQTHELIDEQGNPIPPDSRASDEYITKKCSKCFRNYETTRKLSSICYNCILKYRRDLSQEHSDKQLRGRWRKKIADRMSKGQRPIWSAKALPDRSRKIAEEEVKRYEETHGKISTK